MIDYSHLFDIRDVRQIEQTIRHMDNNSLVQLHAMAEQRVDENSWKARWPLAADMALSTGVSAGLVALTQPLAKWRGWTTKSFGQYMKHPAAIGAIVLQGVMSIFTHKSDLQDANSVDIARIAEREILMRHATSVANGQPGNFQGLGNMMDASPELIAQAAANDSVAPVPAPVALPLAETPALEMAAAPVAEAPALATMPAAEIAALAPAVATPQAPALEVAAAPAVTEPAIPAALETAMAAAPVAPVETHVAAAHPHHPHKPHAHAEHTHKPHAHTTQHHHQGHAGVDLAKAAALAG